MTGLKPPNKCVCVCVGGGIKEEEETPISPTAPSLSFLCLCASLFLDSVLKRREQNTTIHSVPSRFVLRHARTETATPERGGEEEGGGARGAGGCAGAEETSARADTKNLTAPSRLFRFLKSDTRVCQLLDA